MVSSHFMDLSLLSFHARDKIMKIVHVITGLELGGAEMALARLIKTSKSSPVTHAIISLNSSGEMISIFAEMNVKVYALDFKSNSFSGFYNLVKIIRIENPDVVHTWLYHADLIGGVAAFIAGSSRVIWSLRTLADRQHSRRMTKIVVRICAFLSHIIPRKIICVGMSVKNSHIALGYNQRKMLVIPNGIPEKKEEQCEDTKLSLRERLGIPNDARVIGTVGRFNVVKGQKYFVDASRYIKSDTDKFVYLMVGRGCDPGNDELMSWIDATGNQQKFILLGEQRATHAYLNIIDIYVSPSLVEGFPNALAEAMSLGKLCVATDVGDSGFVLGKCGKLVLPGCASAIGEGINEMMNLSDEQKTIIQNAAKLRIAQNFTEKTCWMAFNDVYEKLQPRMY